MNEDQAGGAHSQILPCYFLSQAPESRGGPPEPCGEGRVYASVGTPLTTVGDAEHSDSCH